MAAIIGAGSAERALRRSSLHTDSQYVRQGITEWMPNWVRRGWKTAGGEPVKNRDLWERLHAAAQRHRIEWHWVKGHSGDPDNERVDVLARDAGPSASTGASARSQGGQCRRRMRQIVLDTETTGLTWEQGNRVVEIGCVELVERRPTGRTFQRYLNPGPRRSSRARRKSPA